MAESVAGLTAFSLAFLTLAMIIFLASTDIGNNEVVEKQLLKFESKEMANNIELVADYENEGYAEKNLPENYTFHVKPGTTSVYRLEIEKGGNKQEVDLNVELEEQNRPGNSMDKFSANTICIYEDYQYNTGFPGFLPKDNIYDPEDSNPTDGTVESDDDHVQIYPGECL